MNRGPRSTKYFSLLNSLLAVIFELKYNTKFTERIYFIWYTAAVIVPLSLFQNIFQGSFKVLI